MIFHPGESIATGGGDGGLLRAPFRGGPSREARGRPGFPQLRGQVPRPYLVVIWGEVAGNVIADLPERYSGRSLLIHGVVTLHNGKPEIKVAALKDIEVRKE